MKNPAHRIHTDQQSADFQLAQCEAIIRPHLTKEAMQRYGNVKAAHAHLAHRLAVLLAHAIQAGQVKAEIDDASLKSILTELSRSRDITITRK